MTKWLFSDFDGTIEIHSDPEITNKNVKFLKEWVNNGNKLVLASGRSHSSLKKKANFYGLQPEYYVTNNGSCTFKKDGSNLEEIFIAKEDRNELLKSMIKYEDSSNIVYVVSEGKRGFSLTEKTEENAVEHDHLVETFYNHGVDKERAIVDVIEREDLYGIYFILDKPHGGHKILNDYTDHKNIKVIYTSKRLIEMMPKHVSKARGIKIISKLENIKLENIYSAGDSQNDIEMLRFTNNSFAMNEGHNDTKKAAKNNVDNLHDIKNYI
ncbi:HAD-IIB family hydrolase [Spiroplasma endosymbiont of Othius punctulatus]|uniref:HAD-IIB family hydrolase n=1 Tax=Spiroplasma endosymbiont of Othius punctulatus TaxID=3066289 RepID=UPI0030D00EC2